MNLVSIITPYFRKKEFFKQTIKSVQNQTYKNIEMIVIYDDENLDDLKFIQSIVKKDKRVRIIINKKNVGAGISRNIGIKKAKGDYIAFLDADDVWHKDKISTQIKIMKKNNFYASHTSYNIINKHNRIIGERKAENFFTTDKLLKSCDIGCSTVVLRKKLINSNCKFSKQKTKEDFVLWLKILQKNVHFFGAKKKLSNWRKSDSNLSSPIVQKLRDGYNVYRVHMKFSFLKSTIYLVILSVNYIIKSIKNR